MNRPHLVTVPDSANPDTTKTKATGWLLKISITFDEDASARGAEVLIKYRHIPPQFPLGDLSDPFPAVTRSKQTG